MWLMCWWFFMCRSFYVVCVGNCVVVVVGRVVG